VTIANIITLMRLVAVPVIVWALLAGEMMPAFILFVLAGLSDAVDGAIARTFNQQSELGTVLDPLADKIMLVSVFIVLSYLGQVPLWLTILVVSRDLLIVVGVVICFLLDKPITINPLWISKANTTVQIVLICFVLAILALNIEAGSVRTGLELLTAALTAGSALAYTIAGIKHLSTKAQSSPPTASTKKSIL